MLLPRLFYVFQYQSLSLTSSPLLNPYLYSLLARFTSLNTWIRLKEYIPSRLKECRKWISMVNRSLL